jgi:hypothetical protein
MERMVIMEKKESNYINLTEQIKRIL